MLRLWFRKQWIYHFK